MTGRVKSVMWNDLPEQRSTEGGTGGDNKHGEDGGDGRDDQDGDEGQLPSILEPGATATRALRLAMVGKVWTGQRWYREQREPEVQTGGACRNDAVEVAGVVLHGKT